jgi:sorting nexin-1/2
MGEFAQAITDLSASDVEKQLSHSLAAMADVERQAQELQSTQSSRDIVTLMSTGKDTLACCSYITNPYDSG